MDKAILVDKEIQDGEWLVQRLDACHFPVIAAFWFFVEEAEVWRLYIATPVEVEKGPIATYSRIIDVLSKSEDRRSIGFTDITAVGPAHYLVQLLRQFVTTPPCPHIENRWIGTGHIGRVYVYRVANEEKPRGTVLMSQPARRKKK